MQTGTASGAGLLVRSTWRRAWLENTLAVAVLVTMFDAVLLQQKKAFFTGGFLSAFNAREPLEAAAFLGLSLLTDIGAAGVLVAAAMWLLGRFRLTATARRAAIVMAAAMPFVVADFVRYQLASYLGDAFDLSLMFDLTQRRPSEFLAVSYQHLIGPFLMLTAACTAAGGVVWGINRFGPRTSAATSRVPMRALVAALLPFAMIGVASGIVRAANETFEDGLRRKPSGSFYGWLTELLTDVDRDGFGIGGRNTDPAPFNSAIFPYAIEIPGDGIDQDGIGGDLPADTPPYTEAPASPAPWQQTPDVVLIVLESFRADACGRTVNGKPVTPVLNELARQGISVPFAFSHNGYTAQSRFHLLSGSLAGLRRGSLIDDFKAHGYDVGYFSGQDDSFGGPEFAVGMERADVAYDARQDRELRYTTFTTAGSLAVPNAVVQQRLASFLDRRDKGRPLFLYVNFHDTHYPYHHAAMHPLVSSRVLAEADIRPSAAAAVQEMYFNAAANVDAAIGSTLSMVERHLGASPAVIVTSDHGESLFDEGFLGHGYALNEAQTRIPLIIKGLPLEITAPFGQVELRDAIGKALSRPASANEAPRLVSSTGKKVFQYLGNIDRPRQIAFVSGAGREIYDFRSKRVFRGDEAPGSPSDPPASASHLPLELIRLWERMVRARPSPTSPIVPD
jgi:hypothetical protein